MSGRGWVGEGVGVGVRVGLSRTIRTSMDISEAVASPCVAFIMISSRRKFERESRE